MALRLMSISVCCHRMGYVLFVDGQLLDWAVSKKAARDVEAAQQVLEGWLRDLAPDVVVTEALTEKSRKGQRTADCLARVADVLASRGTLQVPVVRERPFKDKYAEAEQLAKCYPVLEDWVPEKRKCYQDEPSSVTLFEAVALAVPVLHSSSVPLAQAMG